MGFVARGGKEVWRRSGLANLTSGGGGSGGAHDTKLDTGPRSPRRRSTGDSSASSHSTSSAQSISANTLRLRAQPLDTSSILYPTLTSHPSSDAHHILVVSLAHVSSAPPTLSNEDLFQIVLRRLEPWVGEEGEGGYVLIVLADEGVTTPRGADSDDGEKRPGGKTKGEPQQRKLPGVAWWVWRWKRIPRKYRKNLKRFYIVHPSLFTRTLLPVILPFVSPKSYYKLHPLTSLLSLYYSHHVSLKGIDISLPVLEAEARVLRDLPDLLPPLPGAPRAPSPPPSTYPTSHPPMHRAQSSESSLASWGYQTLTSAVGTAASYLPTIANFRSGNDEEGPGEHPASAAKAAKAGYLRRDLSSLVEECEGKVPPLFVELRKAILAECTRTEGVFRRSSNSYLLPTLMAILALPLNAQPNLPWGEIAAQDPLLPPKLLCKVLSELAAPVISPGLYPLVRTITKPSDIPERLLPALPASHRLTLAYVVHMLHHLAAFEPATKMSPLNLAIVLAPALIAGPDPLEDAGMCLAQGKKLPGAMLAGRRAAAGGEGAGGEAEKGRKVEAEGDGTVVGFLEMWIRHYPSLASLSAAAAAAAAAATPTTTPSAAAPTPIITTTAPTTTPSAAAPTPIITTTPPTSSTATTATTAALPPPTCACGWPAGRSPPSELSQLSRRDPCGPRGAGSRGVSPAGGKSGSGGGGGGSLSVSASRRPTTAGSPERARTGSWSMRRLSLVAGSGSGSGSGSGAGQGGRAGTVAPGVA